MRQYYHVSAKQIGFILVVISIILFLILFSSTRELIKLADTICKEICGPSMNGSCPHAGSIPLQSYAGFSIAFTLAGIGVFMILSAKKYQEQLTEKERRLERIAKTLKGDERKLYELVKDHGGAIFQSELVETTGFSKAKVSRILDKLEGRGLVERRRRGMANLVLAK